MALIRKTRLIVMPGSSTPFEQPYFEEDGNAEGNGAGAGQGSSSQGSEGGSEGRLHLRDDEEDRVDAKSPEGGSGDAPEEVKYEYFDPLPAAEGFLQTTEYVLAEKKPKRKK